MKQDLVKRVKKAVGSGQLQSLEERALFCLQYFSELCARFPNAQSNLSEGFVQIQKDVDHARKVFQYQRVADNFNQMAA